MSKLFTAGEICEEALRKIGAYPINDSAADSAEFAEALTWLDLNLAEISATRRLFFLTPATLSLTLTGGTPSYDVLSILGTNAPTNGIEFITEAELDDGNGNRTPLTRITRKDYEAITTPATSGPPTKIYIDRIGDPILTTYPVLGSGITGYTIKLTVQTFGPTTHNVKNGATAHALRAGWQRFAIYELAACLGDGTVRRLPVREIDRLEEKAERSLAMLDAFDRQHETLQRTAFRDF